MLERATSKVWRPSECKFQEGKRGEGCEGSGGICMAQEGARAQRLQVGCTRQLGGEAAVDWAGQIQRLFQLQGDLWMI